MKTHYYLFFLILFSLFTGCKDDNEKSYSYSDAPEIVVERDDLYSIPNRRFIIKAKLKDDLGLKSLQINIPELYLDKTIKFRTDSLLKEYDLEYEFLAPDNTEKTDKYKVDLTLIDVSENSVSKVLTLNLDGDFEAPVISNVKPIDGSVVFAVEDMKLNISFGVTDVTGIDSVIVSVEDLNILDKVKVGGSKTYTFDKEYSIPTDLKTYNITITTRDNFVDPNRISRNISFSVADGLTAMYLADVAKDTDLKSDIFGVPMYYHKKDGNIFTFKYYADKDNKEIFFLGQETSFEPHCFGLSDEGTLENSISVKPIILPKKGYYEIIVNPEALLYTVTPYTPSSPIYNPARITICGNGMKDGGWDPSNTDLLLTANPDNPYQIGRSLTLTGSDVAMTITSPGWASPWWRLDANGIVIFTGGANFSYKGAIGTYKFVLDSELERAILVKE
ncbi:hypothetical protein JGH11_12925 [Dysgonomonas sp. Marseille-P4677]|uniref:hypothetical protein n=1 Tax=Dysgonomonas sp. Marseille-P4677 TaxID=2364790 RepID=UPI001912754A|nr:hypothetical protein [Dysgonomonas sp. Marseille-P4677]MBK5721776.1 hypothetical protein [Dysgonomonas sp. Marseille-P4677]